MAMVDPKLYRKYVMTDHKGRLILYIKMHKALYGLLRSAILFHKKLVKELVQYDFEINPYALCVTDMMIRGSQITVTWHVDDLKVSHENLFEVTKFACYLQSIYGENLTVKRGKVHNYLGMDLDFSENGSIKVLMIKYVGKILWAFHDSLKSSSATPSADHLLQVGDQDKVKRLTEDQAELFHHFVAQILFYVHTCSTPYRWLSHSYALKQVLKYPKGIKHTKPMLRVDSLSIIYWWVDASYNTHADYKGHTGAIMALVLGAVQSFLREQKLNVRSSTKGKLVGIDDSLGLLLLGGAPVKSKGK